MKREMIILITVFAGLVFSIPAHSSSRDVVVEMLKDAQTSPDVMAQQVLSYRAQATPGVPLLRDAPYVGFVANEELIKNWKDEYQAQYQSAYQQHVFKDTYEDWFDMLMSAEASGELPASLSQVSEIGTCLARKVEETDEAHGCRLDNSDALAESKPSTLKLAWMKYTCAISWVTKPCDARQAIFDYAKSFLVEAKKPTGGYPNLMGEYFPQIFPRVFRSEITSRLDRIQGTIDQFVSDKFGTSPEPTLWQQAPLIDVQDRSGLKTGIQEFSQGLSADIRGAAVLATTHPEISAPLFYAAANRILVLMGGDELKWDDGSQRFVLQEGDAFNQNDPTAAPKYVTAPFGGIGMVKTSQGPRIRGWQDEILNGDTQLELFPSLFVLGEGNVPSFVPGEAPYETMEDLGALMSSLVDFLELTRSGPLAAHFVDTKKDPSSTAEIISAKSPALFPSEGRLLAYGLLAAIVRDMISANGHILVPGLNEPSDANPAQTENSGVLGVSYFDVIGLNGRDESKVPTTAVSSVFGAAARLGALMAAGDPDAPQALVQFKPEIDQAVDLSMLSLMARSQEQDGGFDPWFGDKNASVRTLDDQISAIETLETVYDQQHEAAHRLALREAWTFLDHFWPTGSEMPTETTARGVAQPTEAEKWKLLNLWDQTVSSSLYGDLMDPSKDPVWGAHGWDKWQSRFENLRSELGAELQHEGN